MFANPTMSEFLLWRDEWEDYAVLQDIAKADREKQLIFMRRFLDPSWTHTIANSVKINPHTEDEPTVKETLVT